MTKNSGHPPVPSPARTGYAALVPADESAALPQPVQARRKAQPAATLLPRTAQWITSLPAPVRPITLAAKFPHIANLVCAAWEDPPACRDYLAGLLADTRGGRKGFPRAVLDEILALNTHYANARRPSSDMLEWDESSFDDWKRPAPAFREASR